MSKKYGYTPSHHKQYALEHIRRKGQHCAIYTDGSKYLTRVGSAAISLNKVEKKALPPEASVFTSELTAILLAIDMIDKTKDKKREKFILFSDSRSAIEALKCYIHKNSLVSQIKNLINKLYLHGIDVEIC